MHKHEETTGIPRIIMQTWKTKTLPSQWQASQDAILRLLPHWTYHLLTDADNLSFVKSHFPDFLATFTGFEYDIQRADAIRYMWLYVHGGVYLDLDIKILRPLDDLFHHKSDLYIVKSKIMSNVYTNAFMAARPGLPIMLRCLELMKAGNSWWHCGKHLRVINLTGPHMFTRAIETCQAKNQSSKPSIQEIPTDLIIPCSMCETGTCKLAGAYCEILGGSSWSGTDTEFLLTLHCNRKAIGVSFVLLIIIITVIIVIKRQRKSQNTLSTTQQK
jgi:mannosyltransferase OCH1-like enzyme